MNQTGLEAVLPLRGFAWTESLVSNAMHWSNREGSHPPLTGKRYKQKRPA